MTTEINIVKIIELLLNTNIYRVKIIVNYLPVHYQLTLSIYVILIQKYINLTIKK